MSGKGGVGTPPHRPPPAMPAAALAACPVPNNCGAIYSPAGGPVPFRGRLRRAVPFLGGGPLPPGPAAPGAAVAWVPAGTSVPPLGPHCGGSGSHQPGLVAREKGEMPPRGWLCPFPLPCPKTGPFPGSRARGAAAGPRPCPPAALRGWPGRIRCREVILAGGGGGQRTAQVPRGALRGWHPSGPLPVPPAAAALAQPPNQCFSLLLAGGGEREPSR